MDLPTDLHPDLAPAERDALFAEGVRLFDEGRYFEAHEAWETIWRSTTPEPKDLFQGLVQIAVGLYHFTERGNRAPARRVLDRGRRRLAPFAPTAHGLDLTALLEAAAGWSAWLAEGTGEPPARPRLGPLEL